MANDAGGAFGDGDYVPPPPPMPPPYIPPGVNPGNTTGFPGGMGLGLNTLLNTTTTQTPDYNALLSQYLSPYQDMVNQQLSALQEQINKESGFANQEYGINAANEKDAHSDALRGIINDLAARGLLESGDKKWRTNRENTRYSRQMSLLKLALNRILYGYQTQYQNASLAANAGLAQQRAQLGWQLPQMFPPTVSHPFSWH